MQKDDRGLPRWCIGAAPGGSGGAALMCSRGGSRWLQFIPQGPGVISAVCCRSAASTTVTSTWPAEEARGKVCWTVMLSVYAALRCLDELPARWPRWPPASAAMKGRLHAKKACLSPPGTEASLEPCVGVHRLLPAKWFVPGGTEMAGGEGSPAVARSKDLIVFLSILFGSPCLSAGPFLHFWLCKGPACNFYPPR